MGSRFKRDLFIEFMKKVWIGFIEDVIWNNWMFFFLRFKIVLWWYVVEIDYLVVLLCLELFIFFSLVLKF